VDEKPFVLVTGELSPSVIRSWLAEFFHPDHAVTSMDYRVVILAQRDYDPEVRKWLASHLLYRDHVKYLKGSVFSVEDLVRVGAMSKHIKGASTGLKWNSGHSGVWARQHVSSVYLLPSEMGNGKWEMALSNGDVPFHSSLVPHHVSSLLLCVVHRGIFPHPQALL
jgi:hypothetical protein